MAWRKARQADGAKDHRYRAWEKGASPEQSYLGAAGEMNAPTVETNSRRIRRNQVALRQGETSTKKWGPQITAGGRHLLQALMRGANNRGKYLRACRSR